MVKRQKERQYETAREHRANSQLRATGAVVASGGTTVQRRLPFSHCALTLTAYETPVCFYNSTASSRSSSTIVFENSAILPFLLQHKINPVTGAPASSSDLLQLIMSRNDEGAWQCPILTKPFSDHVKIVAIVQPNDRKTAHVYSYEAYQELILKTKTYEDLLTGAPFDRKRDLLVLFDPDDAALNSKRDINSFYHITHARELESNKEPSSSDKNVRHSLTASRIMDKIKKNKQANDSAAAAAAATIKKRKAPSAATKRSNVGYYGPDGKRLVVLAQDVTGVVYTQQKGGTAASLTSTGVTLSHDNVAREATDEEMLQAVFKVMRKTKKKGYVKLRTNRGNLTLELHREMVPRTCSNFLGLCAAQKYDGTVFHRLIPKFMVQGGKPTTANEELEECLWGGTMVDEFDDRLTHGAAGTVSMANAGTHTNKRQFFLTFDKCHHLDRKHSVFGTVVEGMERLQEWQRIARNKKDVPREEIVILGTDVLVDPYQEARDSEQARLEKIIARRDGTKSIRVSAKVDKKAEEGVGRYLKLKPESSSSSKKAQSSSNAASEDSPSSQSRLPPPPRKTTFGNFSGW